MHLLKVLSGILLVSPCGAFRVRSFVTRTTTDIRQQQTSRATAWSSSHPGRRSLSTPTRMTLNSNSNSNDNEVPEELRLANLKAHEEVWQSRRGMARATLSAAKALQGARGSLAGPPDASNKEGNMAADGKGALVISAVGLAVAAATLRVGGRAALISVRHKRLPRVCPMCCVLVLLVYDGLLLLAAAWTGVFDTARYRKVGIMSHDPRRALVRCVGSLLLCFLRYLATVSYPI